jgi:rod shape-determining protein MreD
MKKFIFILLVILAFVLETRLSVLGIRPNLTVLLVYYIGLRYGSTNGIVFGSVLGMIADSLSGNILGPNMLSKGTVGLLSSSITSGFFRWTPVFGLIGVFVLTVIDGVLAFTSTAIFAQAPISFGNAILITLGQAVLNSVAGPFLKPQHED